MTTRISQIALAAAMAVSAGAFVADSTVSNAEAGARNGCKQKASGNTHQCNFTQRVRPVRYGTYQPPRRTTNFRAGNDFSRGRDSEGGAGAGAGDGGAGGGGQRSDVRLKRDIEALGTLSNGLTLYRFKYLWSDTDMVGVMAQEVLNVAPEAVITGEDGFYRVNYEKLGISMMTFEEWKALVADVDQLPLAA
ncbi:MAG: tail fiber domain-containing protein [Pseudomonadota bacterium]